jgi:nucleotide-binding universal stress UspA family protein
MFRKVLIATDGSETSERAAREAIALASAVGAEALAVSVIDTRSGTGSYLPGSEAPYYAGLVEHLRGYARQCVDAVVAEGAKSGVPVQARLLEGVPATAILEAAKKEGADLIVLGTHGRTGLKLLLVGSTAQAVLHGATVPVLLVRR